ncbi:polysaccharide deacetylase family protein [Lachnospiraceae bacterium ZAX-1]
MDERKRRNSRNASDRNIKNRGSRRRRSSVIKLALPLLVLIVILGIIVAVTKAIHNKDEGIIIGKDNDTGPSSLNVAGKDKETTVEASVNIDSKEPQEVDKTQDMKTTLIEETDRLAASYDYDTAIDKIKAFSGYESDKTLTDKISEYEATKASCVEVDLAQVPHIFYHTLTVDPIKCFSNQDTNKQAVGNNQWMTTIDEFNKITQTMYDKGYVIISLHDLVDQTTGENGDAIFAEAKIMLPPGKRAVVLSLDDLSYYHSYDGYGFASKLVLDADGKPKCEYINDSGIVEVGDFDVVPLMDKFIEEHPDASYRGAKGIIALTGYNGILGYRTDITYETVPTDISADKAAWLKAHPDFNLEEERAEAKKVADAMKEDGWEFASHTWGHLKVQQASLERIQADTQKWKENVEPLVGPTDTIIFAHGEDLGPWGDYDPNDSKFQYLKSQGYNFFCNVDSTQYSLHINEKYVRQGRRNLDGYRIYFNAIGEMDSVSDLFDAKEVLDPLRPPVERLT